MNQIHYIGFSGPHGILLTLAWIFAILALVPWRSPGGPGAITWWPWSWLFFLSAMLFGV
jgi:hypothetical protein